RARQARGARTDRPNGHDGGGGRAGGGGGCCARAARRREGLAAAWRMLGNFRAWLGKTSEANVLWERALEHAERGGHSILADEIRFWIAWSLWFGPTPAVEGISRCDQILAEVMPGSSIGATALVMRGAMLGMQGRLAEETRRMSAPDDFEPHARAAAVRARVLALAGDLGGAEGAVAEAEDIATPTEYLPLRIFVALARAEVEHAAGRLEGEREALE